MEQEGGRMREGDRDEEAERELDRIRQMIEAGHYDDPDVGLPLGWEGVEPIA
jgi:predicted fused transcriptional regulator/phosphomethylpyrimidine kinase